MKNLDQFKNYEVDSDLAATTEGGWGYPVLPGPSVPVLPGPSVPVLPGDPTELRLLADPYCFFTGSGFVCY